jgi:hypothetical protein
MTTYPEFFETVAGRVDDTCNDNLETGNYIRTIEIVDIEAIYAYIGVFIGLFVTP